MDVKQHTKKVHPYIQFVMSYNKNVFYTYEKLYFNTGECSKYVLNGTQLEDDGLQYNNDDGDDDDELQEEYWDIGDPTWCCVSCESMMWYDERVRKDRKTCNPRFSLCCMQGKVELPFLKKPPATLMNLLSKNDSKSKNFINNIRAYNMMFSFTSMGGKIDRTINQGRSTYTFKLHGQNYHNIGSLLPVEGASPKFTQLYIYDTEDEVSNRKRAISPTNPDAFDDDIISKLKDMLDEHNSLAKAFRMARDRFAYTGCKNIKLRLIGRRAKDGRTYNLPTTSEVAALIVGDIGCAPDERDIVVQTQTGSLQRINELHPSYLALQYPLLFPYGEDGYSCDILHSDAYEANTKKRKKLTMREFFAFRIMERNVERGCALLVARRLFQQFLVDAYTMIETERLNFIRRNQQVLRADKYITLRESVANGHTNPSTRGRRIVLPSSFTGGARYMIQNYQDAMATCREFGYPDLFITFTCNPKWPEVVRYAKRMGVRPEDRPDILCRVFKIKLDQLVRDLKKGRLFGRVQSVMYTVEFQKRGLPHVHILLFLHREDKFPNADHIDKIISAEIPDKEKNPQLYQVVTELMLHGPCGGSNTSPCMEHGKCSKHFPKKFVENTTVDESGYPVYRRRNNGVKVVKGEVELDNRYVVPYNPKLLLKYHAHINVEWCNQSRSIKYLFKYINKGYDRVTASISADDADEQDEIKMYYDCRYVSACEAAWRIFGFDIHYRTPSVERLNFHLPGEQSVVYNESESLDVVLDKRTVDETMFLAWMECNKTNDEARKLTYADFPKKFVWNRELREWTPRQKGFAIGRVYHASPGSGERYYLRTLLNHVRGPKCYEDIRTVDEVICPTFKEACYMRGLLDDDNEYIDGIKEASKWGTAYYLRNLFAMLLISGSMSRPEEVWEQTWDLLSDDILHKQRRFFRIPDLNLSDEEIRNYALAEIETILQKNGSSLRNFSSMNVPDEILMKDSGNRLLAAELSYDRAKLAEEHAILLPRLTDEQRTVYDDIMTAIHDGKGGVFFLYGYGGTGKTFLWRTLCSAIRSKGEIVLPVASSGIASLLLPNGSTAHSRFGIPLNPTEDSFCSRITPDSDLTGLLVKTKLIIWDEAPMTQKYCFEALDRSLRDVMRFSDTEYADKPFGGKVVVFGGDFRQILPVVPKGSRQDIVGAAINSSYLWHSCKVLKLTKNMRLHSDSSSSNADEVKEFSDWLLKVGDGNAGEPNDGEATIPIDDDLLIKDTSNPVKAIVESTYPLIHENMWEPTYFQERAILAPTNEIVERVNEHVLSLMPGEVREYLSSDSISKADNVGNYGDVYSTEFLNSIRCSGLPNHQITLKIGAPIMLMRNLDQAAGLCNGTRLLVNRMGDHVIQATIISGKNIGEKVLIPRMILSPSDTNTLPIKFQRRQFPVMGHKQKRTENSDM
ncbi:uncharacterized protein LOC141626705 [Silene latifolia]|uniref:uncharacterized protein LOC141626705 n=1 Tax=Silene latifolia TaxID=37657 RepID=UPI003D775D77